MNGVILGFLLEEIVLLFTLPRTESIMSRTDKEVVGINKLRLR